MNYLQDIEPPLSPKKRNDDDDESEKSDDSLDSVSLCDDDDDDEDDNWNRLYQRNILKLSFIGLYLQKWFIYMCI